MARLTSPSSGGSGGTTDSSTSSSGGGGRVGLRTAVLGIVTSWIAMGFYKMSIAGVDVVQTIQGWVLGAFGSAGASVVEAFRKAGVGFLHVEEAIGDTLVQVGATAGLAGPLAVALIFAVVMALTVTVLRGLLTVVKYIP